MKPESTAPKGRPPISDKAFLSAFDKLVNFLESGEADCQYSISQLVSLLKTFHSDPDNFTIDNRTLTKKLQLKFNENLKVAVENGKPTVLFFMSGKLTTHKLSRLEKLEIVEKAVEIIKCDIRSQFYDCDIFPALPTTYEPSLFPEFLNKFFDGLVLEDKKGVDMSRHVRKIVAIKEAIIFAMRERSYVPPLLTNLGIHLHRNYDSKYLTSILHACGFGCSYKEVMKFETAAALAEEATVKKGSFMQMSFDNADINVRTLDGSNTFHAMGGIICATPVDSVTVQETLPRKFVLPDDYKFSTTPIEPYTKPHNLRP